MVILNKNIIFSVIWVAVKGLTTLDLSNSTFNLKTAQKICYELKDLDFIYLGLSQL